MNDLLVLQPVAKELALSRLHAHRNPADVLFVLSAGQALGLNAATALMNIYNVNGTPSLKADLKLALAKNHSEYNGCTIDSTDERCVVKMSRKRADGGTEDIESVFTIEDARQAQLLGKDNWRKYPKRMLKARAVSYAVNDLFPDIVFGMLSHEEAVDLVASGNDAQEVPEASAHHDAIDAEFESVPDPAPAGESGFDLLMKATQGVMRKLVDGAIDGYDNEIRRHDSVKHHLECDKIAECTDMDKLQKYHDHLAAALRGENAKPTIKERQAVLIDRITELATGEELEEWLPKIQSATRHAALDEVEAWLDKNKTSLEGDSK